MATLHMDPKSGKGKSNGQSRIKYHTANYFWFIIILHMKGEEHH